MVSKTAVAHCGTSAMKNSKYSFILDSMTIYMFKCETLENVIKFKAVASMVKIDQLAFYDTICSYLSPRWLPRWRPYFNAIIRCWTDP